ncbi:AAA family ATPase [Ruegeria sp. HKCCC1038]|uniref:AAA family ATPase n=1 Tax=Ruegeria sp. HKCCC1038 TaxID=2682982 RepID=UPI001487F262|nr:AAA family ATPase [Ruegeria sp. HKCCC1038]
MNEQVNPRPDQTLNIPTAEGTTQLAVDTEKVIYVLGRNGTGKSALVQWMYRSLQQPVKYIPGSRFPHFAHDNMSMTPLQVIQTGKNILNADRQVDARYRPYGAAQRNEQVVYKLQMIETQYKLDALEEIKKHGRDATAIQTLQANTSPLDRLNALMEQGNLEVRFAITGGELQALRDGNTFSLAKMSDGERSALTITSDVLVAEPATVFIIDEPELHLHPAIVVPLLRGLMAERPDCGFIISTHELDIAVHSENATAALVRGCDWEGDQVRTWDIDILEDTSAIPEALRVDLFGARRKLMFVEGDTTSLDQPLYALLFPHVSIRCKETCTEVIRAVLGLRGCEEVHHATAFGMVDGDGMSLEQAAEYQAQMVFSVPFYSVESLYYCRDMIVAVAQRQGETMGIDADQLIADAYANALNTLSEANRKHLACITSERMLRDAIFSQLPKRAEIANTGDRDITVSVPSPLPEELRRIEQCIADGDLDAIISRYKVRESPILNEVAKALRFARREDYEKAVLSRLTADPDLREAISDKLGDLKAALQD